MTDKRILFGDFEFPRIRGLDYLLDEKKPVTDYLFVNEPHDSFSMYFETDFPAFTLPEGGDRPYALLEMRRPDPSYFITSFRESPPSVLRTNSTGIPRQS